MSATVYNPFVMSEIRRLQKEDDDDDDDGGGDCGGGGGGGGGDAGGGRGVHRPSVDDRRSRIRRCLFGPVDHDEARRTAREQIQLNLQRDSTRWNFNFAEERPLEGRYEWSNVSSSSENQPVPPAYALGRFTILGKAPATATVTTTTATTEETASTSTATPPPPSPPEIAGQEGASSGARSRISVAPRAVKLKKKSPSPPEGQTRITDFMKTKKRTSPTPDEDIDAGVKRQKRPSTAEEHPETASELQK